MYHNFIIEYLRLSLRIGFHVFLLLFKVFICFSSLLYLKPVIPSIWYQWLVLELLSYWVLLTLKLYHNDVNHDSYFRFPWPIFFGHKSPPPISWTPWFFLHLKPFWPLLATTRKVIGQVYWLKPPPSGSLAGGISLLSLLSHVFFHYIGLSTFIIYQVLPTSCCNKKSLPYTVRTNANLF